MENKMSIKEMQVDIAKWSRKNFPNNKPYSPLLGLTEEVGELSHAHLKMEQGIRGTIKEHTEAKVDAVADIFIYLCDYCERNKIDLESAISYTLPKILSRDWTKNKSDGA